MHPSILTGQQADSGHEEEETLIELRPALNQLVVVQRAAQSSLQILNNSLNWLVGFFQLSEEEKIKAGVFLND